MKYNEETFNEIKDICVDSIDLSNLFSTNVIEGLFNIAYYMHLKYFSLGYNLISDSIQQCADVIINGIITHKDYIDKFDNKGKLINDFDANRTLNISRNNTSNGMNETSPINANITSIDNPSSKFKNQNQGTDTHTEVNPYTEVYIFDKRTQYILTPTINKIFNKIVLELNQIL